MEEINVEHFLILILAYLRKMFYLLIEKEEFLVDFR